MNDAFVLLVLVGTILLVAAIRILANWGAHAAANKIGDAINNDKTGRENPAAQPQSLAERYGERPQNDVVYCPQCGTENPDGSRFCKSCGCSLSRP